MLRPELEQLLKTAVARFNALPPEEREAELKAQREGIARAEASWPKPKYEWKNGVKVYASYKDYLND